MLSPGSWVGFLTLETTGPVGWIKRSTHVRFPADRILPTPRLAVCWVSAYHVRLHRAAKFRPFCFYDHGQGSRERATVSRNRFVSLGGVVVSFLRVVVLRVPRHKELGPTTKHNETNPVSEMSPNTEAVLPPFCTSDSNRKRLV